jgi:hypothetical protein
MVQRDRCVVNSVAVAVCYKHTDAVQKAGGAVEKEGAESSRRMRSKEVRTRVG